MTDAVTLRPLTEADLPVVAPWFEDPDTRRFLGGAGWPVAQLAHAARAVGTVFRGARQIGAHHFLALAAGTPVGYIDCGIFDRRTVYGGEDPSGPVILDSIELVTAAIAFAIAPAGRGRGFATAALQALMRHADLAHVELFEAGVDPGNRGSRGALERAGFKLRDPEPDFEGMLYYECRSADGPAVDRGREVGGPPADRA